jgi:integrase
MAVIAKRLGHADPAITARIYAHSQDEALRAASAEDDFEWCAVRVSNPGPAD